MSRVKAIAEEFTELLNAHNDWTTAFHAEFQWDAFEKLEDDRIRVLVIPSFVRRMPDDSARDLTSRTYGISVVVQKRLYQTQQLPDIEEVDELLTIVEEIWEFVEPNEDAPLNLPTTNVGYIDTDHDAGQLLDPDSLDRGLFTNVSTFTFEDVQ